MTIADAELVMMLDSLIQYGDVVISRNSEVRRNFLPPRVVFNSTPLVTVRKTAWKNALREMEWFLSGSEYISDLHPSVRKWWSPWANASGKIANTYGRQFREAYGYDGGSKDQIEYAIEALRDHPNSRRIVLTTWNAADMLNHETPITNCHGTVIQFSVDVSTNKAHMFMYQRSCDVMVGMQHNWIQYWALLMWLCKESGRIPGQFTWMGGDVHLYKEHDKLAEKLIELYEDNYMKWPHIPELILRNTAIGAPFKADDFELDGEPVWMCDDSAQLVV